MKLMQLIKLAEAAELGLAQLVTESEKHDGRAAVEAAQLEVRKRRRLREASRATRPSRTVRREAIREELSLTHHKVRLSRTGQWHVQVAPGACWLLFALSDADAENLLRS